MSLVFLCIQCPEQKKWMLSFSVLSSRPLGGVGTIRLCQRIKATKLLPSRPLPLYDTSVSNHFHLDNQTQTFPLFLYSLTTPNTFRPFFKPTRQTGNCLSPPHSQQRSLTHCLYTLCRRGFFHTLIELPANTEPLPDCR